MSYVVYTLCAVAIAAAAARRLGYLAIGRCECGPAEALAAVKKQIEEHSRGDDLEELDRHIQQLKTLRKSKEK